MNRLNQARLTINEVDQEIAKLFERRMDAVKEVALHKKENNLPIFDASREEELLARNCAYIQNPEYIQAYRKFQKQTMEVSKQFQADLIGKAKVAYQGTKGAFSHIAAQMLFPYGDLLQADSFADVFNAVEEGTVEYGVIPFENSFTGDVATVMDLCRNHNCHVEKILPLKVDQNLLVKPGTTFEDITHVYSHPQALSQCSLFLSHRPWNIESYPNTALAAAFVAQADNNHYAAIASKQTASLYGLEILQENINTSTSNYTRFIVISKKPLSDSERFNILFTVPHEAGQLACIIDAIRDAGLNMECIKSYPQKNIPWAYYFYIEIVGNVMDETCQTLIKKIQSCCLEFKIVGSYKVEQGGTI